MAKTGARAAEHGFGKRLEILTREWERNVARRLPPEFVAHLRTAVRELFLAVAALSESALQAAGAKTAAARRRVERIPIGAPPATRRRAGNRRRG
jgi:hypothetical protein